MDYETEVKAPVGDGPFFAKITDTERRGQLAETTAEQGLYYRHHAEEIKASTPASTS